MILVFGGAYQGKREYIVNSLGIPESEICSCGELCSSEESQNLYSCNEINNLCCTAKCIYGLENFVRAKIKNGEDPLSYIKENIEALRDKVISITDVSQGVIPMEAEDRAFREANGRCMNYLAEEADEVYRLFCGIPQRVK